MTTESKLPYNEQELDEYIETLTSFYFSKGFWNVRVQKIELPDKKEEKINLNIRIKEGKKHLLGAISFEGGTLIEEDKILEGSALKEGKPISPDDIQDLQTKIKNLYREKSYLASKSKIHFIPQKTFINREIIDLKIQISEGRLYQIKSIIIEGLEIMSPSFIKPFLDVRKGDLYSLDKVEESRKVLLSLGVFKSVTFSTKELPRSSTNKIQEVILYLTLKESNRGDISFGPGYELRSGFLYNMNIFYKNPFGRAHKFLLSTSISEEKNQPIILDEKSTTKKAHRIGTSIGMSHYNPHFFHRDLSEQIHLLYKRGTLIDENTNLWTTTRDFKIQFEYSLRRFLKKFKNLYSIQLPL